MDLVTLVAITYKIIKPILTGKIGKKIGGDFKDATEGTTLEIWEKVKPWFIETVGDEEKPNKSVRDLQEDENNEMAEEMIKSKLKVELYEKEALRKEIIGIIEAMPKGQREQANINIIGSQGVVTGGISNTGGDVQIGDKNINTK